MQVECGSATIGAQQQPIENMAMKLFLILLAASMSVWIMGVVGARAAEQAGQPNRPKNGKLQHVVSFKFKEGADQAKIDALVAAFGALPKKVKEIKGFEWGTNVSPEKHDKGFTHCFIVTFETEKDRDAYLVHPAHKEFGKLVGPIVQDVFVVDFWSQK